MTGLSAACVSATAVAQPATATAKGAAAHAAQASQPPRSMFSADGLLVVDASTGARVPHNVLTPIPVDTELFEGRMFVLFRTAAAAATTGNSHGPYPPPDQRAQQHFAGKRRLVWFVLQGRFKAPGVGLDDLTLGSYFARALRLPAPAVVAPAAAWLARVMGGGVELSLAGQSPRVVAPLIAAAQVVHVAPAGARAPDPWALEEDTALLLGADAPATAARRRAVMRAAAARAGRCYPVGAIHTFSVYDHAFDYSSFRLPVFGLDMVPVLAGQPLGLTVGDRRPGGAAAVDLRIHHVRMLSAAPAAPAAAAAAGAAAAAAAPAPVPAGALSLVATAAVAHGGKSDGGAGVGVVGPRARDTAPARDAAAATAAAAAAPRHRGGSSSMSSGSSSGGSSSSSTDGSSNSSSSGRESVSGGGGGGGGGAAAPATGAGAATSVVGSWLWRWGGTSR